LSQGEASILRWGLVLLPVSKRMAISVVPIAEKKVARGQVSLNYCLRRLLFQSSLVEPFLEVDPSNEVEMKEWTLEWKMSEQGAYPGAWICSYSSLTLGVFFPTSGCETSFFERLVRCLSWALNARR